MKAVATVHTSLQGGESISRSISGCYIQRELEEHSGGLADFDVKFFSLVRVVGWACHSYARVRANDRIKAAAAATAV
jgi:hypothetical protein